MVFKKKIQILFSSYQRYLGFQKVRDWLQGLQAGWRVYHLVSLKPSQLWLIVPKSHFLASAHGWM